MKKTFLMLLILIILSVYKVTNQYIIPDSAIRLRVIPNSNSPKDINIKEKVKDYLEKDIYAELKDIKDIEKARKIINTNIPNIETKIKTIFKNNNYQNTYNIKYGSNYFPQKMYKGKIYKEGYYESLVITIGEGKGDNWWCVLYPNFCLIDKSKKQEHKVYIKEILKKHSKK